MRAMRKFQIVLFLSFLSFVMPAAVTVVKAQVPAATPPVTIIEDSQKRDRDFGRLRNILAASQKSEENERRALSVKATPKDIQAIAVSADDKDKFAQFLKQPRTGIFRLHDISNCDESRRIYNVEEPCPSHVLSKGSAYSFDEEDYEVKWLADIRLEKSNFRIQKIETLSFLTNLGDVPIDSLTLASGGIREMAEFIPSENLKEVVGQHRIAVKGFQVGNYVYKTSRPLKENSSYALRAITYKFEGGAFGKLPSVKAKRLDIIVVFRVVRYHEDGSVTVLWKELRKQNAPKLVDKKFVAGFQSARQQ